MFVNVSLDRLRSVHGSYTQKKCTFNFSSCSQDGLEEEEEEENFQCATQVYQIQLKTHLQ